MMKSISVAASVAAIVGLSAQSKSDHLDHENICTVGSPFLNEAQHDFFKASYEFRLYREDDLKRENSVGILKIKMGKACFQKTISSLSLEEAEKLWGTARPLPKTRLQLPKPAGPDWRRFDVVGIGCYVSKGYLDNRPKYFYVYAKFKNDRLYEYAIDGPDILDFTPKAVAEDEEEGTSVNGSKSSRTRKALEPTVITHKIPGHVEHIADTARSLAQAPSYVQQSTS